MTDAATMDGSGAKLARRREAAAVTATALAEHLDLSRQRVAALADENIIERRPDGRFELNQSRIAYLRWLRSPERRLARSAADAEFTKAKTALLEVRMAEKLQRLVPREVLEDAIDIIVGMYRAELVGLPASFTRDISERRRLEKLVNALLKRVANEAYKRSLRVDASTDGGKLAAFGTKETAAEGN